MHIIGGRNSDHRIFQESQESHTHGLFNGQGQFNAANSRLQRTIGGFLARKYPGHPWAVASEIEHGIVKIAIQGFQQWPYVIKADDLKSDPHLHIVMRGAGELLERLNMPRTGFSLADWKGAMTRLPHHFFRNANPNKVIG